MVNIKSNKIPTSGNHAPQNLSQRLADSSLGGMRLINEKEAAEVLRKPPSWMQMTRHRGDGPPYLKLGRAVRYDLNDLIAWVKAQKRTSTSQG